MSIVIASSKALPYLRGLPAERRRLVTARRHPDGGVWMKARDAGGQAVIQELADRFGTRHWGRGGWVVQRPQLRLPGIG